MMRATAWRPFLTCTVLACFIGGGPAASALAGKRDEPHSGLMVRNGWYVHDGKVVWGLAQHNGWWRAGQRPNIARNAPGAVGPNRTEDLDRLSDAMLRFGYPGFEHNFGLWYDRRRDAHDRMRRTDGMCAAMVRWAICSSARSGISRWAIRPRCSICCAAIRTTPRRRIGAARSSRPGMASTTGPTIRSRR